MPPNGITNDHFCRGLPSWTGFSSTYRIAASMACSLSRNTFHCCSAHMDGNLPSAVAEIFQPERLRQASPGQRPGCEVKRVALQAVSLREKGARNALGKKATPLALHIAGTRPISSPVPSKKQYLLCLAHNDLYVRTPKPRPLSLRRASFLCCRSSSATTAPARSKQLNSEEF